MTIHTPMAHCQHGGLYFIESRNIWLGVYNKENNGFVGIREKLGKRYLFSEYHHEIGIPFGTAWPVELLEICPVSDLSEGSGVGTTFVTNRALFQYLEEAEEKYASMHR